MPSVERLAFQAAQYAFTAHIRDPENTERPADVEDRRMAIYRDLLYNNLEGFIASGFPVLRAITPHQPWHRRVRRFFAEHRSQTPYFAEIAGEFVAWLQHERGRHPDDPPFIQDLVHYEWVETALMVSNADKAVGEIDHNGDITLGVPVVSPLAWHLAYAYPVHRISESFQPTEPPEQPTYLIVYRDRSDAIHFVEINAATYRLLDLLQENPTWTGQKALRTIAEALRNANSESVIAHGQALLQDLRRRNIIMGAKPYRTGEHGGQPAGERRSSDKLLADRFRTRTTLSG